MAEGKTTYDEMPYSVAPAMAAIQPEAELSAALYARVTWRIVPILCIGFLVAYIDRANVGFAKLRMLGDLGFSETVYGLGSGLFFVGYIAFEIPSNIALRHVGAKIWLALIMVVWGVLSGAMTFADTPAKFYLLRFLLGLTEAGFFPGVIFYFATWFPLKRRSRVTALFLLAIPLSGMVGSPLSGWIMARLQGRMGLMGWQWLFLIEAATAICLAAVTYRFLPSSIATAGWLTSGEKAHLLQQLAADRRDDDVHSMAGAIADIRVWLIGAVDMTLLLGMYAIIFWLPTIVRASNGLSIERTGFVTAIPHLAGMIAMLVIGWHSDMSRERRWHVILPMTAGAAALATAALFKGDLALTIVAFSIANAGIVGALPALLSIPGAFLGETAAAAGLALVSSIGNLAGFFSTYLTGRIMDATHSVASALVAFALCLVLGAILTLLLPARLVDR